jgi:hypothetical protein
MAQRELSRTVSLLLHINLWIPGLRQVAHPGMTVPPVPPVDRRHRKLCQFIYADRYQL